jgi:ubiquinol-cytochrome c reductase cytochrome c1 subunit
MVRFISWLVGLGFCAALVFALVTTVSGAISEPAAPTAEHEFHKHPKELELASNGWTGKFDRQQLQRGLQVYKEVCAACHSLKLVAFRDVKDLGYTDGQIKTLAKGFNVPSINPETGEPTTRPGVPADKFPSPFANDIAARAANNNSIPPDLSLMTKARHDGAAYVYSLLTGYQNQPAALLKEFPAAKTPPGLHYNPYFPNLNLAMPAPLTQEGQVTYADGTKPTVDQMAKDVSAFLVWTAEPKLEARHTLGWAVIAFLAIFVILSIGAYRAVWANKEH